MSTLVQTDTLDFGDLTPIRLSVKIDGKQFWLPEADGSVSTRYKNAEHATRVYNSEGRLSGYRDLANLEPLLVSWLLVDDKNEPVPLATIASWPARIQHKLYEKAREISDLGEGTPLWKELLDRCLAIPGAPVHMSDLANWVMALDKKEYRALQIWFEGDAEDKAKND